MSPAILKTKLFIPTLRAGIVSRSNLIKKLDTGRLGKLTLISAPAGYGKTTLLAEWIKQQALTACWVSLDPQDNDLQRFFAYLGAGLRNIDIEVQENIPTNGKEQPADSIPEIVHLLINQVTNSSRDTYLVLDDYHRITNPEIHQAISYLLENLPDNLHLLIATRSDPPLRLAKLRAQGELCEIRVDDLRFTSKEAVQFLNQSMDLNLTLEDIATLNKKTEGWIAGLQLAGLSLLKDPDKHKFVIAFAGDDRYIADYLLDEALNRQPKEIQTFLLETSILDRLCAPLCNAVTGRKSSQSVLLELDQANLFLIALDNQRHWYRYHHLFADLLQSRLKSSRAADPVELHHRASRWYEDHHLMADAVNHALAANEIEQIVHLTEEMAVHKMDAGEIILLKSWLDHQPEEVFLQNPWLMVARTWFFFNSGNYDEVETGLEEIEKVLAAQSYSTKLVNRIQGHAAAIRAYLAEIRDAPEVALPNAENALKLLSEQDIQLRAFVAIRWANAASWKGDYPNAIQALEEAGKASKLAGDGHLAVSALSEKATLQMIIGQLNQAVEGIFEIKEYAETLAQKDGRQLPAMGQLYRQLSNLLIERNQLDEAEYYAQEAVRISRNWGEKEALFSALTVLSIVHFINGDYEKFEEVSNQSIQIAEQVSPYMMTYTTEMKNHLLLRQGRLQEVEAWSQERNAIDIGEYNQYQRLAVQNTAHLLVAQGKYAKALELIEVLLRIVGEVGAKVYTIRYKVLQAKIYHLMNQPDDALNALAEALAIASPEGFVRSFMDEGETIAQLLYQASEKGIFPEYCSYLLDEFSKEIPSQPSTSARTEGLVEPLSEREIEVLGLIAKGYSNQEIAQELYLSLYTVKSHARNIFSKLCVKNRTEAVAKARFFGVLPQK